VITHPQFSISEFLASTLFFPLHEHLPITLLDRKVARDGDLDSWRRYVISNSIQCSEKEGSVVNLDLEDAISRSFHFMIYTEENKEQCLLSSLCDVLTVDIVLIENSDVYQPDTCGLCSATLDLCKKQEETSHQS
jgi:hypothetical protein